MLLLFDTTTNAAAAAAAAAALDRVTTAGRSMTKLGGTLLARAGPGRVAATLVVVVVVVRIRSARGKRGIARADVWVMSIKTQV